MPRAEASSSTSRLSRSSQNDPRRPAEVKRYERPEAEAEPQPQDPMMFLGLIFGMVALILKMKIAAWLSVFCVASAFANMRTDNIDFKQLLSSLTWALDSRGAEGMCVVGRFAVMGIVACYIVPASPPRRQPQK